MPIKPFIGQGQQFNYESSLSPAVYSPVKGLQTVTPGSTKTDTVDVTDTDSGQARVFIAGLTDNGDVTLLCNHLPGDTSQVAMKALFDSGATTNFEWVYADSLGMESFAGIVVSADRSGPQDKENKITYKIKISGTVTVS